MALIRTDQALGRANARVMRCGRWNDEIKQGYAGACSEQRSDTGSYPRRWQKGRREAAQEVLKALGVDIENTIEAQKDMHFLSDVRKDTSSVKGKVINTVVGALALAGLYKLFSGVKW